MTVSNNPTIVKLDQCLTAVGKAMHEGSYDKAIAETSDALHDLILELQVMLLDKRAHARVMKNLFREALVDAKQMMELAPTSSSGYLRAGDIYTRQGEHAAAVATYKRAMSKVLPWDPRHVELEDLEKEAGSRVNEVGIDFVKLLPKHIVGNIFERLSVPRRLECIDASPLWKAHINQNPELWRVLYCLDKNASEITATLASRIGIHVEELYLTIKSKEATQIYRNFVFNLHEGKFPRLTTLVFEDVSPTLFGNRHGPKILSMIGRNLKRLTVSYAQDEDATDVMLMGSIMELCPKLEHFKYATKRDFQSCLGDINPDKKHPVLSLDIDCISVNPRNLTPVLMKCPRIRRLTVIGADLSSIQTITRYCPDLLLFGFDVATVPQLTEEQRTTRPNGIRMIRTLPYKIYNAETWMPLITAHQTTMEHVAVKFHYDYKDPLADVNKYTDLRFQKLQSLATNFFVNAQAIFVPAIRGLDTLTELTITCSANWKEFVDAVLTLKNLKRLVLGDSLKQRRNYSQELTRLFRSMNAEGAPTLEHLELRQCIFVSNDALLLVAGLPKLKEIILTSCSGHSAYGLQDFFKKLQEHKNVTSMELAEIKMLEDSTLGPLGEIQRLRSITLRKCPVITDSGIKEMVTAITATRDKMDNIVVYNCPQVTWNGTKSVLETFPSYRLINPLKKRAP